MISPASFLLIARLEWKATIEHHGNPARSKILRKFRMPANQHAHSSSSTLHCRVIRTEAFFGRLCQEQRDGEQGGAMVEKFRVTWVYPVQHLPADAGPVHDPRRELLQQYVGTLGHAEQERGLTLQCGCGFAVLSDILGDEDHLGDMDFKVFDSGY
jgi:hypothetical protein